MNNSVCKQQFSLWFYWAVACVLPLAYPSSTRVIPLPKPHRIIPKVRTWLMECEKGHLQTMSWYHQLVFWEKQTHRENPNKLKVLLKFVHFDVYYIAVQWLKSSDKPKHCKLDGNKNLGCMCWLSVGVKHHPVWIECIQWHYTGTL